jgi:hypothetical protein
MWTSGMVRVRSRSIRGRLGLISAFLAVGACGLGQAGATALPRTSLGVNVKVWYLNGQYAPTDLSKVSRAGAGVARVAANEGTDMDGVVRWLAEAHLRLYPTLGLPCPPGTTACGAQTQIPPATAATEMAGYITAFAQRYGPKGTFWSANPNLPYLPVKSFEIGNEPNIRMIWVEDETHLHWADPSNPLLADYAAYARVYGASRTALHRVDPSGLAVIGGLADSASFGVDVQSAENLLSVLPRHGVDAVGYHPWVFDVSDSLLRPDTADLRVWMNRNGLSRVPLQVNELGACGMTSAARDNQTCPVVQTSARWGAAAAAYTRWSLCTSWLDVKNVQPFVWGATPVSDQDIWLPLVASNGAETPYGYDFLAVARKLSRAGCPRVASAGLRAPTHSAGPAVSGTLAAGRRLRGTPGTWRGRPKPKLYYQWERCNHQAGGCISIAGANSARYTLRSADEGSTMSLLVTAVSTAGGATANSCRTTVVIGAGATPAMAPAPACRPRVRRRKG